MVCSSFPEREATSVPGPTLSEGFVQLSTLSHEKASRRVDRRRGIPTDRVAIWEHFAYPIFLGFNTRSAQAVYATEVFRDLMTLEEALSAGEDDTWSQRVQNVIDQELGDIQGTPGEGLKRSMLRTVEGHLANADLVQTVYSGATFVQSLDLGQLAGIRGNFEKEFTFAKRQVESDQLHHVKYIKFVLWMHGCDVGLTLTPPTGSIVRALSSTDLGFKNYGFHANETANEFLEQSGLKEAIQFNQICLDIHTVARKLRPIIGDDLWEREVQYAAWILGTTRGLFAGDRSTQRLIEAASILSFIEETGRTLEGYEEEMVDIERLMDFMDELKKFLAA
jgi:hypothetical protein